MQYPVENLLTRTSLSPSVSAAGTSARTSEGTGPEPRPQMFYKLESLRGVAACLVFIHHSPFLVADQSCGFVSSSYLFVDYFFILSGFVVTHAYRARILTGMPFRRYFSLRLGRLYPVHLFAHLLYAANIFGKWLIHRAGFGATNPADWVNTPSFFINLCLFQAFGLQDYLYWNRPSWSISSELVTYVVFFVLTLTCDRRPRIVPLLVGVGALYAVLLGWPSRHLNYTYDFGLLRCVAGFYLGSALYRLRARMTSGQSASGQSAPEQSGARWSWTPAQQTLAELGCLGAVALCVSHAALGSLWLASAIAAFAASILVFSSSSNGAVGALLERKPLRKIGVWSYSIYLLHLVWLEFAADLLTYGFGWDVKHGLGLKAWLADAVVLAVVLLFARWTHEHIEEPLRKRVRQLAIRPEPSTLAIATEPARAL